MPERSVSAGSQFAVSTSDNPLLEWVHSHVAVDVFKATTVMALIELELDLSVRAAIDCINYRELG